jgi:hypothetical protein
MILAPAATAATLTGASGTPDLYSYGSVDGCATMKAKFPTFNLKTGVGSASMTNAAKTCSKAKGGTGQESYADSEAQVGESHALTLRSAASVVNVTANVKAAVSDMAKGVLRTCPTQTESFVSTWVNSTGGTSLGYYNDTYSDCYAEAGWEAFLDVEVEDLTTNTYIGYGTGFSNTTGNYYDSYNETINYTNPLWTNVSYNGTSYGSYGLSNSTTLAWAPTVSATGSWSAGDHLEIYSYVFVYAWSEIYYETKGVAHASIDAAGSSGHIDITKVTIA